MAQEFSAGGKIAGKYTLIGRVGRGGMGEVWIARNEATGADVAIKTLRPDRRTIDDAEERFRHEARVAARLRHRHVCHVYDLAEEGQTLLLVMERLHGDTLKQKLNSGPISPSEMVEIALPILEALGAAHEASIVHRDVTPGNIFLAEEQSKIVPKLIDFGVAKAQDAIVTTKTGHALGTPQYMSPEQIRSGKVDGRSDLFSLAVTMYEAITGANPFKRNAASGSLAAVLETEIDPDPRIPPRLWIVLSRALSKQAYERYENAAEMARALREAMSEVPAVSEPPPRSSAAPAVIESKPIAKPRNLVPFALAGVGVLAGIIAIAFVVLHHEQPKVEVTAAPVAPPKETSNATPPPAIESAPPPPAATSAAPVKTTAKPVIRPATTKTKPVATTPGF